MAVETNEDKELREMEQEIEKKSAEEAKTDEPVNESPGIEAQPSDESSQAPEPPDGSNESDQPPEQPSEQPGKKFDAKEWVKKKGWTTPEDAAKSIRELEQKFHQQSVEMAKMRQSGGQPPSQPGTPPYGQPQGYPNYNDPGAYQPPPNPYGGGQPGYAPPPQSRPEPAPPIQPLPNLNERQYEEAARMYNMETRDFKRVYALQKDMIDTAYQRWQDENNRWKTEWTSQNERQSDMARVMSDPSFHIPDVQMEMHEIFSKTPSLWNERRPWSTALNHALVSIGRRNLVGGQPTPSNMSYPTNPPNMAGGNNRGSSLPPGVRRLRMPSMKELESKSPEEIEKVLRANNAVKDWKDL